MPKNLGYSKLSPGGLPPIVRPPDNLLGQMPKTRAGQWNVGHDAFSSASVWLENVARQGKRVGDRQTAEPVVYKGDMTLKEFKKMKEPVRRLIANAGALPARKLVKVQDDQALFEPLSKEERDMKVILQMISEKAAQRFGSIRDALRHLDADCDGSVDRGEVRYFFRSYNVPEEIADKFFDFLDEEKRGELDYGRVVNFLRPFLEGAINGTPLTARDLTKGKGAPDYLLEEMLDATDEGETRLALFDHQFEATLRLLAQKVIDRFGTTAAAFRFVDLDRNGIMTRNETRYLFRLVNFPEDLADKFHDSVDTNGSGEISLQEFYASLAPYVDIQERPVAKREDFVLKPDTPETPDEVPSRAVSKEWTKFVQNSQRVELRRLMQDIGDKLQLKFKHVRDAFKPLNLQRLGRITRAEMRSFFRGFGHPQEVADRVYDLLQDKRGEVEYAVFMSHFESVLGRDFRQVSQPPILEMGDFLASREVDGTIETFKRFLITKCRNLQEAYRVIDGDKDGKVSRQEMRLFAKRLGVPSARADQLFDALDVEGLGSINYLQFTRLFPETWERPDPGPAAAWPTPRAGNSLRT